MNTQQNQLQNMRTTFDMLRRNALANPMVYGGRYTQKSKKDAYIEYLETHVIALTKSLLVQK
mgnify:CR=1 FL=1